MGSRSGSGSWRALLVELPDGSFGLVALPLDHVDATVQRVQVAVLIAGGAVVLALAAAGWWLSRLGLRPIAEVTSVAGAIANGERDRRVTEGVSGTEAAQLARAFNRMLDERDASEAQLRRFVADASHELRTPVTAIGGFADLWRQGSVSDDELAEMMRRIGHQSSRMRGLVEDLLLLAHLDEGTALARGSGGPRRSSRTTPRTTPGRPTRRGACGSSPPSRSSCWATPRGCGRWSRTW